MSYLTALASLLLISGTSGLLYEFASYGKYKQCLANKSDDKMHLVLNSGIIQSQTPNDVIEHNLHLSTDNTNNVLIKNWNIMRGYEETSTTYIKIFDDIMIPFTDRSINYEDVTLQSWQVPTKLTNNTTDTIIDFDSTYTIATNPVEQILQPFHAEVNFRSINRNVPNEGARKYKFIERKIQAGDNIMTIQNSQSGKTIVIGDKENVEYELRNLYGIGVGISFFYISLIVGGYLLI